MSGHRFNSKFAQHVLAFVRGSTGGAVAKTKILKLVLQLVCERLVAVWESGCRCMLGCMGDLARVLLALGPSRIPVGTPLTFLSGTPLTFRSGTPLTLLSGTPLTLLSGTPLHTERYSADISERYSADVTEQYSADVTERYSADITERYSAAYVER